MEEGSSMSTIYITGSIDGVSSQIEKNVIDVLEQEDKRHPRHWADRLEVEADMIVEWAWDNHVHELAPGAVSFEYEGTWDDLIEQHRDIRRG